MYYESLHSVGAPGGTAGSIAPQADFSLQVVELKKRCDPAVNCNDL